MFDYCILSRPGIALYDAFPVDFCEGLSEVGKNLLVLILMNKLARLFTRTPELYEASGMAVARHRGVNVASRCRSRLVT